MENQNTKISSPPKVRPLLTLCLIFLCLDYLFFIANFIVNSVTSTFSIINIITNFLISIGGILVWANLFILPICFHKLLIRRRLYNEPSTTDFRFFIILSILTAITHLVFYLDIIFTFICFAILYPIVASTVKKPRLSQTPIPPNYQPYFSTTITPQTTNNGHIITNITSVPPSDDKPTRNLLLVFIAVELLIILPIYSAMLYMFNPQLHTINGPTATLLDSVFIFFGILFLTIVSIPLSIVFSYIIREQVKRLKNANKTIRILRIILTIISSSPIIPLILSLLYLIKNSP